MDRTNSKSSSPTAREDSRPVRYELIDKDGKPVARSSSIGELGIIAASIFPDQSQDPDRTGKGWDVQVVGTDDPAASRASHYS